MSQTCSIAFLDADASLDALGGDVTDLDFLEWPYYNRQDKRH